MHHLAAAGPRLSWSIDCAPRLGGGDRRRTIVVAVDDYTKYTIISALDNLSAEAMADWVLSHLVAPFGAP